MRILITNHRLALRTGSELFAGELARALRDRGHEVALFSPQVGALAEALRVEGLTVLDDLSGTDFRPEVIHGQHHLATMTALCAFPKCRAVYLCHGYLPWEEWPPSHPRITTYAAVSETFLKWFSREFGIDAEKFAVVPNGVDLRRFRTVRVAPEKPRKALVFDNGLCRDAFVEGIAAACLARGITLDCAGRNFGADIGEPADFLPNFDLVFAAGRSALEALTCGCAVILMSRGEFGGRVTAGNLDYHYGRNFALGSRGSPELGNALDAYDATDVAETTRRLRAVADQGHGVERLLQLYERPAAPTNPESESAALAAYLQKLASHVAEADEKFVSLREGWQATKRKHARTKEALTTSRARLASLEEFFRRGPMRRFLWRRFRKGLGRDL